MNEQTLSNMHGRDQERFDYIWSHKQCSLCGIMIVDKIEDAAGNSKHPEWHLDVGGVCTICFAECAVRSMGLNPLNINDNAVAHIMAGVIRSISLLVASYDQRDPTGSR